MHSSIAEAYPNSEIHLVFATFTTRGEAEALEEVLLKRYLIKYGEIPPLNSAIPNRYHWTSWEDAAKRSGGAI